MHTFTVIPAAVLKVVNRQWLYPFLVWLDVTLASIIGGQPTLEVDAAATATLASLFGSAFTYDNGTLGVGATLTGDANGAFPTVDGVAPTLNKTYLVTAQASGLQNGPYKLTVVGDGSTAPVLTRLTGMDQSAEFKDGAMIGVRAGTINADSTWKYTGADTPTLGVTALTFARDPGVVTTNTAQSITALKSFAALMLAVWNAGVTFATKFTSLATATRTFTLPDVDMTPAQATVATGVSTICGHVRYQSPIAAELITISADAALAANGARTIAAQPAIPRKLQIRVTIDTTHAVTAGTLDLVGVGPGGEAVTESVSLITAASATFTTTKAYSTLTSATVAALAQTGGAGTDSISIGVATAIGLPIPSGAASVSVYKAGVAAAASGTPVNEAVGTVDTTARTIVPTTAADGTKSYDFWFSYTHTHTQT